MFSSHLSENVNVIPTVHCGSIDFCRNYETKDVEIPIRLVKIIQIFCSLKFLRMCKK